LFFPEKREFFLENQGLFAFGGASTRSNEVGDTPILFHSRRIGLNSDRLIPIDAGARLTGRLGRYSFGLLDIGTGEEPDSQVRPTNFAVVRLKRDILRKSSVGTIFTRRSVDQSGGGKNVVYGLDGTFSFYENLAINTYWAKTKTDGPQGDDTSYRAQLDYTGDRYGLQVERLTVGNNSCRKDPSPQTYSAPESLTPSRRSCL
jgi:hypothetical protein